MVADMAADMEAHMVSDLEVDEVPNFFDPKLTRPDSIAVSVFADIFIELTNTVSDNKIQMTILIL